MYANAEPKSVSGALTAVGLPANTSDTDLEPDICWQAMQSRDRRFDGRFFVAAVTTGIYCRPICPAPFAKPNNISLFPCAAAAEAAGFRPCHRCRPETAPGTPAWVGTSAVVSRALRLIWEGALDAGDIESLAKRVGIGSRQLRRLFIEHLGVPPIKIAITHRLHFARNLIEETNMAMAEIAVNAGFRSIRAFNHAVRTTAGQSPSELRRLRGDLAVSSRRGEFAMRLLYRPPFNWSALIAFLKSRATPGVERVEENLYQRTIESEGGAGVISVSPAPDDDCLVVRVALPKYEGLLRVVERVRRVFDLGADPLQIAAHLSHDPQLKPFLDRRPGIRVPGVWDGFEVAVRTVLGQRLTAVDSNKIAAELVQNFGRPVQTFVEGLTHLFPRPEDLADAEVTILGVPEESATAINTLSRAVSKNDLNFDTARNLQDTMSNLRAIGIADEASHYIAMRAFGEPDAFPLDNQELKIWLSERDSPEFSDNVLSVIEAWRPWRAYAAMHLWAAHTAL
jgi:AraC family transcriptional regulator of adaptative response / DNA-3-methyladenine glycosylase II